jgi:hypothetical protein
MKPAGLFQELCREGRVLANRLFRPSLPAGWDTARQSMIPLVGATYRGSGLRRPDRGPHLNYP